MHYKVISFDLDGTLVDTAGEIAEAANRTLEDFGVPRRPEAEIQRLIGAGLRALMLQLLAHVLLERPLLAEQLPTEQVLARLDEHYARTVGTSGVPYPGCVDALQQLADAGVRLACVTNKEQRFAKQVLEVTRLEHFFELVIGGDSLPHKKPHRGVLDHVAKHFHVSHDQLAHVGDSRTDMEAARNAGVSAWGVPWGYNAGEPIESAKPLRIFHSMAEVAGYVLEVNAGDRCAAAATRSSAVLPP